MNVFDKWVYINLVFISWGSSTGERAFDLGLSSPSTYSCTDLVGFPGGSAIKNLPVMQELQETQVWSLDQEESLEEGMATHSSILARRIPQIEEPGGLQSIGSQRVGHDWSNLAHMHTSTNPLAFPGLFLQQEREISLILNVKALSNCRV